MPPIVNSSRGRMSGSREPSRAGPDGIAVGVKGQIQSAKPPRDRDVLCNPVSQFATKGISAQLDSGRRDGHLFELF